MPKSPKRPRDANQLARMVVDLATGERTEKQPEPPTPSRSRLPQLRSLLGLVA
jgi:hypothetical protein